MLEWVIEFWIFFSLKFYTLFFLLIYVPIYLQNQYFTSYWMSFLFIYLPIYLHGQCFTSYQLSYLPTYLVTYMTNVFTNYRLSFLLIYLSYLTWPMVWRVCLLRWNLAWTHFRFIHKFAIIIIRGFHWVVSLVAVDSLWAPLSISKKQTNIK